MSHLLYQLPLPSIQTDQKVNNNQPKGEQISQNLILIIRNIHSILISQKNAPLSSIQEISTELFLENPCKKLEHMLKECVEKLESELGPRQSRIVSSNEQNLKKNKQGYTGERQNSSRQFQIKLVKNMRKVEQELEEKNQKIKILNNIILKKQEQIVKLENDIMEVHQQVQGLQSQNYELTHQLQSLQSELQTQKQCNDILSHKLNKLYQKKCTHYLQQTEDHLVKAQINQTNSVIKSVSETAYEENNCVASAWTQTDETDYDDTISQNSNITQITQSKQSKYLESIDRLTSQLSTAYEKINDIMRSDIQKVTKKKKQKRNTSSYFEKILKR